MRVLAFTGMPGAGKSEAVAVAKARGFPVVRMGEFVWEETRRRGLPIIDENVGRVATEFRTARGADYWAQVTADHVLEKYGEAPLVLIDGVRNHEEVEAFRNRLGDRFELVAVTAPPDIRTQRLVQRGRSDDARDPAKVRQRDDRELGWGIAKSIALADHTLTNEGDLVAFRESVSRLFDRLLA